MPNIFATKPVGTSVSIGRASVSDRGELIPCGELGHMRKDSALSNRVGPGSYSHRDNAIKNSSPNATIGNTKRELHKKEFGPGVGAYNPEAVLRRMPSAVISMSAEVTKFEKNPENPGPGAYNPKESVISGVSGTSSPLQRGFTIFKAASRNHKSIVPGPGTYEAHTARSVTLGGAYNATMGTERRWYGKKSEIQLNPGPGQYNPSKTMRSTVSVSIPQGSRYSKSYTLTPGPGYYKPKENMIRSKTPSMLFPGAEVDKQEARNPFKSVATPGPGTYNQVTPKNGGYSFRK